MTIESKSISIKGAKENNLRNININIPKNKLVVITGVSGSGKSSLAFDTIYAEGKRRYMNSLSSYTRHFEMQSRPDIESIVGLSPAIAIEQKNSTKNPRSTVATVTEIYDYLRVLFARVGIPYSPSTAQQITKHTPAEIINKICNLPTNTRACFVIPAQDNERSDHCKMIIQLRKHGCTQVIVDNVLYDVEELPLLDDESYIIEGVMKEITITQEVECRQNVIASVYRGMSIGNGVLYVDLIEYDNNAFDAKKDYYADVRCMDLKTKKRLIFSEKYCCPISDFQIDEIEPKLFSFNSPHGACKECEGLGIENAFNASLIVPNPSLSIQGGAIAPWEEVLSKTATLAKKRAYDKTFENLALYYDFSLSTPFMNLSSEIQRMILYGPTESTAVEKNKKQPFEGIIPMLEKELENTAVTYVIDALHHYQTHKECSGCNGTRLKVEALAVKIAEHNIGTLCRLTIGEMYDWFISLPEKLTSNQLQIADKITKEVTKRLGFLIDIGVDYLTLNRRSATLSGGESQRIKIASQLGCGLEGLIYVLDEPSIGLHQSDNDKLLAIMQNLRDMGNTLVVVEHDEDTIKASDYLIDVGPGAGKNGGEIVACGTPQEVAVNPDSITGQYLSGKLSIAVPLQRRKLDPDRCIEVLGASSHNLQNIDVKLPLGCFIAISGVSGSGKSTFAIHTLYKALINNHKDTTGIYRQINGMENIDKVIQVDQSPIGRTPRSNPITYINVFTMIRECFASQQEAKNLGFNAGCFSFNVKGGRCESCEGDGVIKIEMHFMPDVYINCEACNGMRYNGQILQVKYKDKSIADVLRMTTDEAVELFCDVPFIHEKLVALQEVGLGYLQVGQSATTLSGGEAQRIKLAKELSRRSVGSTFYILDEPTTGLHLHDIKKLLNVLHKLVESGHTVVTIEHNLDVIKNADYVVDFGPYGGNLGGRIIAAGTPEDVAMNENSLTGKYLKPYLKL